MSQSKVYSSAAEALKGIVSDGQTLAIGGFGLCGMWFNKSFGDSSQGQEPIEQFKRELGYALCQLSYEIALFVLAVH